ANPLGSGSRAGRDDLLTVVVAAVGAHSVGASRLAAMRTRGHGRGVQLPARPALLSPRAGVPALGYSHLRVSSGVRVSRGGRLLGAPARLDVEIRPAPRAEPAAILPAQGLNRKRQEQGFADFRGQVEAHAIMKAQVLVAGQL